MRDLLISGEAPAAEVVECLVGVLHAETAPTCVEPYLALVTRVAEYWSPEADRAALSRLVAQTCAEFVEQGRYQQAALRAWARTGSLEDLDQLDEAVAADVDLRWRVLARRAELGDVAADDELDRLVEQDPDPEAWVRALTVRTAVADAGAKAARLGGARRAAQGADLLGRAGRGGLLAPRPGRGARAVRRALPRGRADPATTAG